MKEYMIHFTMVTNFPSKGNAKIRNEYREIFEGNTAKEALSEMYRIYGDLLRMPTRSLKLHSVTQITL